MNSLNLLSDSSKDYISFRNFLCHLSGKNDYPLHKIVTHLLSCYIESLDFYYIDEDFKVTPSRFSDKGSIHNFLKRIQNLLTHGANEWVFTDDESLESLEPNCKDELNYILSEHSHYFFRISNIAYLVCLQGLLHLDQTTDSRDENDNEKNDWPFRPFEFFDKYGRTYDIEHCLDNRDDEYLTVSETIRYLSDNSSIIYDEFKLRDLARKGTITPCFYFNGYVGSFSSIDPSSLYTEILTGYFTHRFLNEGLCTDAEYINLPCCNLDDTVSIYRILDKKTAEYSDRSIHVFLFRDMPKSVEDADKVSVRQISTEEIRFSQSALDNYLGQKKHTSNDLSSENSMRTQELTRQLSNAKAEIIELENKLRNQTHAFDNDKELPYNSQMAVAKMLHTIFTIHKYDLSVTKGKANSLIEKASQLNGTPVTRNFIAKWIELSNQAKSDSTK